jgi:lysophospholipase L1-like esterase
MERGGRCVSLPPAPVQQSTLSGSGTTTFVGLTRTSAIGPIVQARWILMLGDSKTAFHGDEYGHWQDTLMASLSTSVVAVTYQNKGIGSVTVASYTPQVAGLLVGLPEGDPVAVLINLSVNDSLVGPMPTQAAWTANYLTIIDLLRARWPRVPIYVMRWWSRLNTAPTDADVAAGWIAALLGQRADLYLGPDERVFLKGADDGATMTYDGIHQNAAGMTATAAAWQAVLWP